MEEAPCMDPIMWGRVQEHLVRGCAGGWLCENTWGGGTLSLCAEEGVNLHGGHLSGVPAEKSP